MIFALVVAMVALVFACGIENKSVKAKAKENSVTEDEESANS